MMQLDTQKPGMCALFKPYKAALLKRLYEVTRTGDHKEAQGSGQLWNWLLENADKLGVKKVSRASVIFALNDLVDRGFLKWKDATGKGGHHRLYSVAMTPYEFEDHVIKTIVDKLTSIFDEADWWRLGYE